MEVDVKAALPPEPQSQLEIVDAIVFNYGARVSFRIKGGPLLPHTDTRFPQQRLRVVKLTSADLLEIVKGRGLLDA